MRDQDYLAALTLAPTAAELAMQLYEVNWALILVRPPGILDLPKFGIYKDQAPWAKKWVHSHVIHSHIPI
jgi:hypothetical protein